MGLDSCVKKYIRKHVPKAVSYHSSAKEAYEANDFCATIIDLNVELHRKPQHITTGEEWVSYIYNVRVRGTPGQTCVLVIDNPSRVPEVKDLCHLARAGQKRKRNNFIPLPADTAITNGPLPDWTALTGSKYLLPRVWDFLLSGIRTRIRQDATFDKTVFFDTCYSWRLKSSLNCDGNIHLVCCAGGITPPPPPTHAYGEGDLKCRCWARYCLKARTISTDGVLILSVDLDNIPIFCNKRFNNVCLMANTVTLDDNGEVVPRSKGTRTAYEIINLGGVALALGQHSESFRALLCLSKNDFNDNPQKITTERMLKTFFAVLAMGNKKLDAERLLGDVKYYHRFAQMCLSKVYGNRNMTMPRISSASLESYQCRGRWCYDYWSGKGQRQGGPDCRASGGWEVPTSSMDLKEYKGKVRLIPS
tara:strand:+ start:1208 stop:2464 length:1257 start_codon:yes stop_codon:yes gene_type:complete